jgi:hypothetical protein
MSESGFGASHETGATLKARFAEAHNCVFSGCPRGDACGNGCLAREELDELARGTTFQIARRIEVFQWDAVKGGERLGQLVARDEWLEENTIVRLADSERTAAYRGEAFSVIQFTTALNGTWQAGVLRASDLNPLARSA